MNIISLLGAGAILIAATASTGRPMPAGHQQHHAPGKAMARTGDHDCCCGKDMHEMMSMMHEMMRMHEGMNMHKGMDMHEGMKMPDGMKMHEGTSMPAQSAGPDQNPPAESHPQ